MRLWCFVPRGREDADDGTFMTWIATQCCKKREGDFRPYGEGVTKGYVPKNGGKRQLAGTSQ